MLSQDMRADTNPIVGVFTIVWCTKSISRDRGKERKSELYVFKLAGLHCVISALSTVCISGSHRVACLFEWMFTEDMY